MSAIQKEADMHGDLAAYVHLDSFRSHGVEGLPQRAYYIAWHNQRLLTQLDDGGTLWIFTSSMAKGNKGRRYHLAYRLADCKPRDPMPEPIRSQWGRFGVVSRNWDACEFYPANDATKLVRGLRFRGDCRHRGMKDVAPGGIGMKLQSFPRLAGSSVRELHKHAWNLLSERVAFLSYSRRNQSDAACLVRELQDRGIEVAWDRSELHGGDEWKEKLRMMVSGTDVFLLLWSKEASKSCWVHRELSWALGEMKRGRHVSRIIPVIMSERPLQLPVAIRNLHYVRLTPTASFFDLLTRELLVAGRRSTRGWRELRAPPRRRR